MEIINNINPLEDAEKLASKLYFRDVSFIII